MYVSHMVSFRTACDLPVHITRGPIRFFSYSGGGRRQGSALRGLSCGEGAPIATKSENRNV